MNNEHEVVTLSAPLGATHYSTSGTGAFYMKEYDGRWQIWNPIHQKWEVHPISGETKRAAVEIDE